MKPLPPKSEGSPSRLLQTLDRLAQQNAAKKAKQAVATPKSAPDEAALKGKSTQAGAALDGTGPNADEDVFQSVSGGPLSTPLAPRPQTVATSGGGALSARFAALSGDLSGTGRVVHGDLTLESPADCAGLAGVKAVLGTLSIVEGALSANDLAPLGSLAEVGGLALEGNAALGALDALSSLKIIDGACYLGFNPALQSVALPKLERAARRGALGLLVEGNAALTAIQLGALHLVGRYVHICENPQLKTIDLEGLAQLDELVLTDNPQLEALKAGRLPTPKTLEVREANGLTPQFIDS